MMNKFSLLAGIWLIATSAQAYEPELELNNLKCEIVKSCIKSVGSCSAPSDFELDKTYLTIFSKHYLRLAHSIRCYDHDGRQLSSYVKEELVQNVFRYKIKHEVKTPISTLGEVPQEITDKATKKSLASCKNERALVIEAYSTCR